MTAVADASLEELLDVLNGRLAAIVAEQPQLRPLAARTLEAWADGALPDVPAFVAAWDRLLEAYRRATP